VSADTRESQGRAHQAGKANPAAGLKIAWTGKHVAQNAKKLGVGMEMHAPAMAIVVNDSFITQREFVAAGCEGYRSGYSRRNKTGQPSMLLSGKKRRQFMSEKQPYEEEIVSTIINMERCALDRWCGGDPSGFLEISASDVVYFDPYIERRIDGLDALTRYYEGCRGQVQTTRYELLNPKVQSIGDAAVLTFNYISYSSNEVESRWNCTEVYRRETAGWRIIQTHWSLTPPRHP
jgi:hypothetical protein